MSRLWPDLSSVFNWNVRQLFVFLIAEYKTKGVNNNQVVLWDSIVLTPEAARLNVTFTSKMIEYGLIDSDLRCGFCCVQPAPAR